MIRALLLSIGGVVVLALAYALLFTGGGSHGMGFATKSLYVEYEISRPGVIRPPRLGFLVVMDGVPDAQTRLYSDGKHQFTFGYKDGNSLVFTLLPGQTAWVGRDRKPHITWTKWTLDEVESLERLYGTTELK